MVAAQSDPFQWRGASTGAVLLGARRFQPVYGRRCFQPAPPMKKPKNRPWTSSWVSAPWTTP